MPFIIFFVVFIVFSTSAQLENTIPHVAALSKKTKMSAARRRRAMRTHIRLKQALDYIQKKDYLEGVRRLFILSGDPALKRRRTEIRYIMGTTFLEMGLLHAASFQFISVIRTGHRQYIRRALEKMSQISAQLGDDTMLKFAVEKGNIKKMRKEYRHSIYYQYGKYKMKEGRLREAAGFFKKVPYSSPLYEKAQYNLGLSYAERNQNRRAVKAFDNILSKRSKLADTVRTAALMAKARTYYQAKRWRLAAMFYRQIPRDTSFWHDMLLENSWTLLRQGKFRSALNSFQTLHSSYYQEYYQPESLLVRAIIYMYICKYDEMKKVLDLLHSSYSPVKNWVKKNARGRKNFYFEILKSATGKPSSFPKPVALQIYRENDFQLIHRYIRKLEEEKSILRRMPASWRNSKAGRYAKKLVSTRFQNSKKKMNRVIRRHLQAIRRELDRLFHQEQYLRAEVFRGQRKQLRQKISRRRLGGLQIIAGKSRDFFVQNGFEFWPFKGEYWLDELGNYHYVGSQNCR